MTTIGMNYEVREGKAEPFEKKFIKVLEAMQGVPGHVKTNLYRNAFQAGSYLVISEWQDRPTFDAFVGSETFRAVTSWGKANILATRPTHVEYGAGAAPPLTKSGPTPQSSTEA